VNIVHLCDCMEFMKGIPDKYYELAIVDPPYGIGADKKNSKKTKQTKKSATESTDYGNKNWDSNVPSVEYFKELFRISKDQIIWGVNYYPYGLFAGGRIYWDKKVTMPTYSNGEIAYCSKLNSIKCFEFAWHGMIQGNMSDKEVRIHPTQKPVALYKWLLQNYAKPGDKIFDSHVGSGSIRIACHDLGFDFEGCEIDKDYWEAQEARFQQHIKQADLFEPQEIQDLVVNGELFVDIEESI
jgi:site-specific DNA-methyltransferase (adenine-specific)